MTIREIRVPKVPARAFDKSRKPSDLIRRQLEHLQHVVARHPGGATLAADMKRVRTEGQAATYIGRATAFLRADEAEGRPDTAKSRAAETRRRTATKRKRPARRSAKR